MLTLGLDGPDRQPYRILCLGAHCDDIEIGCGGTILALTERFTHLIFNWVIFSSDTERRAEASKSACAFLRGAKEWDIAIKAFRDGFFPFVGVEIKEYFEELKEAPCPDLILTHYRNDLHQDHRLISDLTWNTFRNHLILEYEIPKYDGDLGSPNLFVPLDESICHRKLEYILNMYKSQSNKHWFSKEVFWSILRLRGMEANAPGSYAEAFYGRKLTVGLDGLRMTSEDGVREHSMDATK